MQPGTKLALHVIVGCLLGLAFIGALVATHQPPGADARKDAGSASEEVRKPASDPWPECAAVREWFRGHAADPASVEIVEWERRFPNPYDGPDGNTVQVRYRGRNQFGALAITSHFFAFRGKTLVRNYPAY